MSIFRNRTPNDEQAEDLDAITEAMENAYDRLAAILPNGRYRSLAITKLEECSMHAKKSVLFD
jgi:hypothetical protein